MTLMETVTKRLKNVSRRVMVRTYAINKTMKRKAKLLNFLKDYSPFFVENRLWRLGRG